MSSPPPQTPESIQLFGEETHGKGKPMNVAVCAVLSPAARKILEALACHEEVHCHHLTIFFKPTEDNIKAIFSGHIGRPVTLKVIGIVTDNRGQAVIVEPLTGMPSNRRAHITVSCADGTKPVYSNELIEHGVPTPLTLELEATIQLVTL
jgi:hypothetical protein